MRVLLKAASLAVLVVALAVPATADHGDIHPTARLEQTYFHCAGDVKVQNVSAAQGTLPSWDTNAPTQSVQDGAGCGYYENIFSGGTGVFTSVWEGTFTGNLNAMTVELHRLLPMSGVSTTLVIGIVEIDGVEVFNGDIRLQPVESASGASNVSKFSLRNLKFMTEDGEGTTERSVRISIDSYNEQQSAWVWDTREVPSGITFNPTSFAGSVIAG